MSWQVRQDYANLAATPALMKLVAKNRETCVLFSDTVLRVDSAGKLQTCLLIVTDRRVYTAETETCKLRRKFSLQAIVGVQLARNSKDFFALIVPQEEKDCIFATARRAAAVNAISEACAALPSGPVAVEHCDAISCRLSISSNCEVTFGISSQAHPTAQLAVHPRAGA
ncbi:hypothetical protein WJX72_002387 [[Myrmecia] bisecta]|uniref:TH1 domain-containing protein n=1 Tax=[Myrmecia] bisecta TaxID=41462 RepID=A0AAW1PPM4_9CHLO